MRRSLRLALLVAVLPLAFPATGGAATYTVRVCADPATGIGTGEAALPPGWKLILRGTGYATKVDCGGKIQDDAGIVLSGSGSAPAARNWGDLRIAAPAYTGFLSANLYRRVTRTAGDNTISSRAEAFRGVQVEMLRRTDKRDEVCVAVCARLGGTTAGQPFQAANRMSWSTSVRANALRFLLICDQSTACAKSSAAVRIYGGSFVLQDDEVPSFSVAPTGPLTAGGTIRGTVSADVTGADRGSGLLRAEVLIDGAVRQSTPLGSATCAPPYVLLQPCSLSVKQTLSFDTTLVPDGAHNVSIRLVDATTANSTTFGPVPVTVDNETDRGEPNGQPAADRAELRLSLSDRPRRLRYGRSRDASYPYAQGYSRTVRPRP